MKPIYLWGVTIFLGALGGMGTIVTLRDLFWPRFSGVREPEFFLFLSLAAIFTALAVYSKKLRVPPG